MYFKSMVKNSSIVQLMEGGKNGTQNWPDHFKRETPIDIKVSFGELFANANTMIFTKKK